MQRLLTRALLLEGGWGDDADTNEGVTSVSAGRDGKEDVTAVEPSDGEGRTDDELDLEGEENGLGDRDELEGGRRDGTGRGLTRALTMRGENMYADGLNSKTIRYCAR